MIAALGMRVGGFDSEGKDGVGKKVYRGLYSSGVGKCVQKAI
jgi:hypothetical protein